MANTDNIKIIEQINTYTYMYESEAYIGLEKGVLKQ